MVTCWARPSYSQGRASVTVRMNGENGSTLIPMMPSHLGADTIIKFEKANVIYIEDFYRNFGYPFADQVGWRLDLPHGGSRDLMDCSLSDVTIPCWFLAMAP